MSLNSPDGISPEAAKDIPKTNKDTASPNLHTVSELRAHASAKNALTALAKGKQDRGDLRSRIEEIKNTRPTGAWSTIIEGREYILGINLLNPESPSNSFITGTLTYFPDLGRSQMKINNFKVAEGLQGHGIGTRLLRNLVAEAQAYDADSITGHVTSESALRTRAKVFGKDNLQFFDHITGEKLDTTYEEVLKENPNVDVVVDIKNLDTTDWERPEDITLRTEDAS
jgi:ribosomal protein S18 acetylase RimI-like enzyme